MDRKFMLLRSQHAGDVSGGSRVQWMEWECTKDMSMFKPLETVNVTLSGKRSLQM